MTTDLFSRLGDADPARSRPGYDEARLTALARSIADRDKGVEGSTASSAGSVRRRLLLAVPVAGVVVAALVIAPMLTRSPGVSAEAATLLNHAADSITTTDPAARPSQWWKITTTGFNLAGMPTRRDPNASVTILQGRTDTQYVAVDGSRPSFTVTGPATFIRQLAGDPVTPADLPEQFNGGTQTSTSNLSPNDLPGTWQTPNSSFLSALPRNTAALRQRLYLDTAGAGRSADGEVFVAVADVLRSGLVPADLRAALYRVLATVPGVEITAPTATIGTSSGVAFGRYESTDGTRQEIIINPSNGDLVGEREVAVNALDGIPARTVIGQTAVSRTLLDAVPTSIVHQATVYSCSVHADAGVECTG